MPELRETLLEIAETHKDIVTPFETPGVIRSLAVIEQLAKDAAKCFSGSWIGYHSTVYYDQLQEPPPGAHFSIQWGLMDRGFNESRGRWVEYTYSEIRNHLINNVNDPSFDEFTSMKDVADEKIEVLQDELSSLLRAVVEQTSSEHLKELLEKIEKERAPGLDAIIRMLTPPMNIRCMDMLAFNAGLKVPPHIQVMAEIIAIRCRPTMAKTIARFAQKAASYLRNYEMVKKALPKDSKRVFIGHGHSAEWLKLKNFIQDILKLQYDEFERIPNAGKSTVTRLEQMLEDAGFAFIVMTAEDDTPAGLKQARLNVIHEAGLFQGKLGFDRAIILLEKDCEEFSNIVGLTQIRFPKGNIKAVFEDIRQVLQRENIIPS